MTCTTLVLAACVCVVGGRLEKGLALEQMDALLRAQALGLAPKAGGAEQMALRAVVAAAAPAELSAAAAVCTSCCTAAGAARVRGGESAMAAMLDADPLLAQSAGHPCAPHAMCAQIKAGGHLPMEYVSYLGAAGAATATAAAPSAAASAAAVQHSRVAAINIWLGGRSPNEVFWKTLRTFGHAHAASVLDYIWFVDDEDLAAKARAYGVLHSLTNLRVISRYTVDGVAADLATFVHHQVWLATKAFTGRTAPATYRLAHNLCDVRPLFGLVFEAWIAEVPRLATSAGATHAPTLEAYTHWGWIDQHTSVGNLAKFLGVRFGEPSDLDRFDVVSFRFLDAAHIFTSGQLSIFRNTPVVNHMWESVPTKHLAETFDRDPSDPKVRLCCSVETRRGGVCSLSPPPPPCPARLHPFHGNATQVGRSMVFDEFRGSNAFIEAKASTRIRIKVTFVAALSPEVIVARVEPGSDAAGAAPSEALGGALLAGPAVTMQQSAQQPLQSMFERTAAVHNAALLRRAAGSATTLPAETTKVADDTARYGGAPLAPSWRDVPVKTSDIAPRWVGKHLLESDRGFFAFWRDRDGRWFKRAPSTFAYVSDLMDGSGAMKGTMQMYEAVLAHTRGALCTIKAADAPGFKGSDPRYSRCGNSR